MNWFLGIRTPWTLSSEFVCHKTNRIGGRLFMLLGVLLMATTFLPSQYAFFLLMAGVTITVVGTLGISFYYYIQEKKLKR